MEYDSVKGLLFIASATGLSCWSVTGIVTLDVTTHVMEKLFNFDGCNEWISWMMYDAKNEKLFGVCDMSVYVFNTDERRVVTNLRNIHDAPVTRACWYPRSQYYLTGCRLFLLITLVL